MSLSPGSRLGPYEILSPLGAGGMGEVYRAVDTRLKREVAVKVLAGSLAHDADRARRFELEARAASALNHPNIVAIYDIGAEDGAPFIVSELLDGETLRARLSRGALPPREALGLAFQVAQGLAAAHAKGVIHRDLKPENLFLTAGGVAKILDFGLVRIVPPQIAGSLEAESPTLATVTEPGVVIGTVGYMSPEQLRGRTVDARSDIFSLGAVLYEMLTGRRAFHAESAIEIMIAILREEPPPMFPGEEAEPALERVVRRCLRKMREDRFQSARDLGDALEELVAASPPSPRARRSLSPPAGEEALAPHPSALPGGEIDGAAFSLIVGGREIPLPAGPVILGRARDATIRLRGKSVSRHHARILVRSDGATLENLGSKNGTYLRGRRIDAPAALADGDEIGVGELSMVLRITPPSATTATSTKGSPEPP